MSGLESTPPHLTAISVLMPAYNAGRHVAEAVESILAQTLGDFEFIIIDDGSKDRTLKILRDFEARDPRIRLVSRPNLGLVRTLNEGVRMARGKFVARMDADDVALPERFALQVAFLEAHPEVVCVGGESLDVDETGRWVVYRPQRPRDHEAIQEQLLRGICPMCHPTAMIRRDDLLAVGGYDEEFAQSEDLELWLRLGERGRLANLSEVVLRYRRHPGSKTEEFHDDQPIFAKLASDRACQRRGIPPRFEPSPPYRPGKDREARFNECIRYGWAGFMEGNRPMALDYGLRIVRLMPWRVDGWRLLACALLKKPTERVTR